MLVSFAAMYSFHLKQFEETMACSLRFLELFEYLLEVLNASLFDL